NGDTHLGGDDFDQAIMQVVAIDLGTDLSRRDSELLQRLRDLAERTKIALSDTDAADFVLEIPGRDLKYRRTFTRAEFEALIAPHLERSLTKCRSALRDAHLTVEGIDEVVLVGGSTRIPLVRRRVGEVFGRMAHTELNPDEVV